MSMTNAEARIIGKMMGMPEDKIEELCRMQDMRDEIDDCLYDCKAINIATVNELNRLLYKHFPEKQDGSEFTREEPAAEPKVKAEKLPEPDGFSFGTALAKIKAGGRCARNGWNGKGQYIELAKNIGYETQREKKWVYHKDIGSAAIVFVGTRGRQVGWLASQADMLAEDWYEVEG